MQILAIETSCDETAVSLVKADKGNFFVMDEYVSSQAKVHSPFGGVVPNLAAREHVKNLPILLKKIIKKNKIDGKNVDLIAVTQGPGLIPALLVGTNAAKALAYAWKKPLVGVNHVEGHIYANMIGANAKFQIINPKQIQNSPPKADQPMAEKLNIQKFEIKFPVLALIVSGGHTELILMKKHLSYKILGRTLDDAAGEAFDKAAKILNLGYPGGPAVSKLAKKYYTNAHNPIPDIHYSLPRPMLNSSNFNFSFSGLKTALLYTVRDNSQILKNRKLKEEICYEFQQAIVDVLVHKTITVAKKYRPKTILLGGGVSANKELRKQLGEAIKKELPTTNYSLPTAKYSLDNASMIAVASYFHFMAAKNKKEFLGNWKNMEAEANLSL